MRTSSALPTRSTSGSTTSSHSSPPCQRPRLPRERRRISAEVLVHVAYSMFNFSVRDGQEHAEAIIELKRLLTSYLLSAEAGD